MAERDDQAERWLLQENGEEQPGAGAPPQGLLLFRDDGVCGGGNGSSSSSTSPPVPSLLEHGWTGCGLRPPPAPAMLSPRRQWSVADGLGSLAAGARDGYKEAQRRQHRTVFNLVRWKQHRSSGRYWRHMFGAGEALPDSECSGGVVVATQKTFDLPSKVRALAGPLSYVLIVSTLTAVYHALAEAGKVPPATWATMLGNNAPFQLTSFALSLLLVFRYARFLDARKAWGSVTNRSRDLARQGLAYLPPGQPELAALLCRWIVAFSHSMMCSLRGPEEGDEGAGLRGVLPQQELSALLAADHRPLYALQVLASVVARAQQAGQAQQAQQAWQQRPAQQPWKQQEEGWKHQRERGQERGLAPAAPGGLPAVQGVLPAVGALPAMGALQLAMDANLTALEDALGTCERILRTPIPLGYTRHTSRFLMIWLTLLPFTLWDSCRWAMLPIALIVAFLLLGIEEIGVQIEEPFSILPLCHICRTIRRNVEELLAAHGSSGGAQGMGRVGGDQGRPSAAGLVDAALMALQQ